MRGNYVLFAILRGKGECVKEKKNGAASECVNGFRHFIYKIK
jgi:hypothetical protein